MTAGLDRAPAADTVLDGTASRALLAVLALAAGGALGWLAGGRVAVLSGLAILLAATNGYSKAYSP